MDSDNKLTKHDDDDALEERSTKRPSRRRDEDEGTTTTTTTITTSGGHSSPAAPQNKKQKQTASSNVANPISTTTTVTATSTGQQQQRPRDDVTTTMSVQHSKESAARTTTTNPRPIAVPSPPMHGAACGHMDSGVRPESIGLDVAFGYQVAQSSAANATPLAKTLDLDNTEEERAANQNDRLSIQKRSALHLWINICQLLEIPKEVRKHIIGRLKQGFVPPVFHACSSVYNRMGGRKTLQQGAEATAKQENKKIKIDPKYLPSMKHVTNGIANANEVGEIIGKQDIMQVFFTKNGKARKKVAESVGMVWASVTTKDVCQLINTEALMIGADVEITKVESDFGIGTVTNASSAHLITRRLSRGVVAECLCMPAEDTRAIVGCPGIGKSWTLAYALQQLLLQNGSCVVFFAAKAGKAFTYIRRDDKVYGWTVHSETADSALFRYENVWVLVDPKDAKCEGTKISTGKRHLLLAASNNELHFASDMLKRNEEALHYLDPCTEEELRVALPVMSSSEVFDENVLIWASKVGMLPRYLLNENEFIQRLEVLENAAKSLRSNEVAAFAYSRGISNSKTSLPELVLAVCAAREVSPNDVKVPIGYNGESGVIYTETSISVMTEYIWNEFTKHDRESILSFWSIVDSFEFTKQRIDVENLLGEDLKHGILFETWDMKNNKFVLPPTSPKHTKPLFRKDYSMAQLKDVFDCDNLLVQMLPESSLVAYAGPGRKVFQLTVGIDYDTMSLDATEELLVAVGYMERGNNGKYVAVPDVPSSPHPKLDFYLVVPHERDFEWREKSPMRFTEDKGSEVAKALARYVNQYVLVLNVNSPSIDHIVYLVTLDTRRKWCGKKVVVTGEFTGYSNEHIRMMAFRMGAVIQKDVGQMTVLVIKGSFNVDDEQVEKAKMMSIQVMEENEFLDTFQN